MKKVRFWYSLSFEVNEVKIVPNIKIGLQKYMELVS